MSDDRNYSIDPSPTLHKSVQGLLRDFREAIAQGNQKKVAEVLGCSFMQEIDAKVRQAALNDALHSAVLLNDVDIIRTLLREGAQINAPDKFFTSEKPINRAVFKGHVEAIQALVAAGASIEASDVYSPIHDAARCGHTSAVTALLELKADVNGRTAWNQETPLHAAVQSLNPDTVKALIAAKADVGVTIEGRHNLRTFAEAVPAHRDEQRSQKSEIVKILSEQLPARARLKEFLSSGSEAARSSGTSKPPRHP